MRTTHRLIVGRGGLPARALTRTSTVLGVACAVAAIVGCVTHNEPSASTASQQSTGSKALRPQPDDEFVLHFPTDRSLGKLWTYVPQVEDSSRELDAIGSVPLPRGSHVALFVSQPAADDIASLGSLVDEGLVRLHFQYIEFAAGAIDELATLTGLESLNFSSCTLTDSDLEKLSKLTSLKAFCFFGGPRAPITDQGVASLQALHKLESLEFYGTQITDLAWQSIAKFKLLKSLRLGDKSITDAGFVYLKELPCLEYLTIENLTSVSDTAMAHLAAVPKLKSLRLEGRSVKVSDAAVAQLSKLEQLQVLDLSRTTASSEAIAQLKPLESLTELRLPYHITDDGLARIGEFSSLKQLQCFGDEVTDDGLTHISRIPELESLNISGERITDRGMRDLARLTTLSHLILQHCQVGDEGLGELAMLKSLVGLTISGTRITSEGLRHLQQLPALKYLSVQDLAGPTADLRHLRALPNLESLEIGNQGRRSAKLNEADLDHLAGMKQLKQLNLSSFPMTDEAVKRLTVLDSLESLDLNTQGTQLTDQSLVHLAGMKKLNRLSIGGDFTDVGLAQLATSRSLRNLTIISHTISEVAIANLRRRMSVDAPLLRESRNLRITEFFARQTDLQTALAAATSEAHREKTRPLIVLGDPQAALAKKLIRLFEHEQVHEALGNYETVPVTSEEIGTLADSVGASVDALRALSSPGLILMDDDGKMLADRSFTLRGDEAFIDPKRLLDFLGGNAPTYDAEVMLAAALDQARREDKRVFFKQTGAYCGPCRTMSKFWEEHASFLHSQYVYVAIDGTRFKNGREINRRYRPGGGLIPWVAILDGDGNVLTTSDSAQGCIGFPSNQDAIDHFMKMISTTARHASPEGLQVIRAALERRLSDKAAAGQAGAVAAPVE